MVTCGPVIVSGHRSSPLGLLFMGRLCTEAT